MGAKRINVGDRWYSVEWTCSYRNRTTYVVRAFGGSERADVVLGSDGSWGEVWGQIPEGVVRSAVIQYIKDEYADFVRWAGRQSFPVNVDEYPIHVAAQ